MVDPARLPQDYPPARHVLRDLQLWSEAGTEQMRAGMPVAPPLFGATGALSAGALAVLVDAVAGGAALLAAEGGWIATADLRLHLLAPARAGEALARAEALRSGRSNVVVEVEVEVAGARAAHAVVAFSRLEAKGEYQQRPRRERMGRMGFGEAGAGFAQPWREALGAVLCDAAEGAVELPLTPYVGNSLGGVQGGVVVALADLAAEAAGRAWLGAPVATRDLALHFLAIGRSGPLRTRVTRLRRGGGEALLRVETRDAGGAGRLCTLATVSVAPAA